jgi:hypothetical protein
MHCSALVSVW